MAVMLWCKERITTKSGLVFVPRVQQMLADFMIVHPRAYYVLREAHNVNPLLKEL
jgi:hypothetical protein